MRVLFLFGPNLGTLGRREPERYGTQTLEEIMEEVAERGARLGHELAWRQTDHEGELIGWLNGAAAEGFQVVVANPGALSHTSYALRDAVEGCGLPVVEVHMTNIYAREEFRRPSVISAACRATIAGAGAGGYHVALEALPWITGETLAPWRTPRRARVEGWSSRGCPTFATYGVHGVQRAARGRIGRLGPVPDRRRYCGSRATRCRPARTVYRQGYPQPLVDAVGPSTVGRVSNVTATYEGGSSSRTGRRLELVPVGSEVEQLRRTKDPEEIALIDRAQGCADRAFETVVLGGGLREGVTERALAFALETAMVEAGAEDRAFDSIVAFGDHAAEPHHHLTDRELARGDMVKLDFGARSDGYHSDITRTVAFGEPDQRLHEIQTCRRGAAGGIEAVRPEPPRSTWTRRRGR